MIECAWLRIQHFGFEEAGRYSQNANFQQCIQMSTGECHPWG